MVWPGLVRSGRVGYGRVWSGLVRRGLFLLLQLSLLEVRYGKAWLGWVRLGQAGSGKAWRG